MSLVHSRDDGKDEQDAGSNVSAAAAATGHDYSCDVTSELSSSDIIQVYRCIDVITGE